ncbi:MAG: anti-sigma factor family protein [Mycobacteriales bacterium]
MTSPHPDLVGYATGRLAGADRQAATAHLAGCPACRAELAGWQAVRGALRTGSPAADQPPAAAPVVAAVLARSAADPVRHLPVPRHRFAWQLLRAQLRLVRPVVWVMSVLVTSFGVVLAGAAGHSSSGDVFGLVAPLVAAAGVAALCGPDQDPAFEIGAATATPPSAVLLARITVVFCYDLLLSLAASAVLAGTASGVGVGGLIGGWFGPMALLSAVSLLLAVRIGTGGALGAVVALWCGRVFTISPDAGWAHTVSQAVWGTNALTVLAAVVVGGAGVLLAGRPRAASR